MKSICSLILVDLKLKINAHRYFQMNHFKGQRQNMEAEIKFDNELLIKEQWQIETFRNIFLSNICTS